MIDISLGFDSPFICYLTRYQLFNPSI